MLEEEDLLTHMADNHITPNVLINDTASGGFGLNDIFF
jgi:hypothetical protein